MTQEELDQALDEAVNDRNTWKKSASLFSSRINSNNTEVDFMRSLVFFAGPIQDSEKRYKNINDELEKQRDTAVKLTVDTLDLGNSTD